MVAAKKKHKSQSMFYSVEVFEKTNLKTTRLIDFHWINLIFMEWKLVLFLKIDSFFDVSFFRTNKQKNSNSIKHNR